MNWWVLLSEPMRELFAAESLRRRGYRPYVPVERVTRTQTLRSAWGQSIRRTKVRNVPIFRGYIFCPVAPDTDPLYTAIGLRPDKGRFMRVGETPVIIDDNDIEMLRMAEKIVASQVIPGLPYYLHQKVKITAGPLADRIAEISRLDKADRIELLLEILGRRTRIVVSSDYISAV